MYILVLIIFYYYVATLAFPTTITMSQLSTYILTYCNVSLNRYHHIILPPKYNPRSVPGLG